MDPEEVANKLRLKFNNIQTGGKGSVRRKKIPKSEDG